MPKIDGDEYDPRYEDPNPNHTTHYVCDRVLAACGGGVRGVLLYRTPMRQRRKGGTVRRLKPILIFLAAVGVASYAAYLDLKIHLEGKEVL